MLRRLQTLLWITLVLLFAGSGSLLAAVGVLKVERGMIKVSQKGVVTILKTPGQTLEVDQGAKITSAKATRGQLFLNNKRESIDIYALTYLNLKTVTEKSSQIVFPTGKAKFKVKHRPGLAFKVRTASALVGVKGTEFLVQALGSQTQVLTLDGVVTLASAANPNVEVEIGKNKASSTTKTGTPAKPVTVSKENQQQMLQKDEAKAESFIPAGEPAASGKEESSGKASQGSTQGEQEESLDSLLDLLSEQQDQISQIQEDVDEVQASDTGILIKLAD